MLHALVHLIEIRARFLTCCCYAFYFLFHGAVVVAAVERSIWAIISGSLQEFDLDGTLRRKIPKARLISLGLKGVTTLAQFRGRKILLGMRKSNSVAIVDPAPSSVLASIASLAVTGGLADTNFSFAENADGVKSFSLPSSHAHLSSIVEPAGQSFEDEVIQKLNPLEVERFISLPALNRSSLGHITYDYAADRILYTQFGQSSLRVFYLGVGEKKEGCKTLHPLPSSLRSVAWNVTYSFLEEGGSKTMYVRRSAVPAIINILLFSAC